MIKRSKLTSDDQLTASRFDGTGQHHPFYFFVAFKEGSEWDAMPISDDSTTSSHWIPPKIELYEDLSHSHFNSIDIDYGPNGLAVYPNPASDKILIISNKNQSFEILDCMGQITITGTLTNGKTALDIANLSQGTYFINFPESNTRIKLLRL